MSRPIDAVPKGLVAIVATASVAVFVLVRLLFPGFATGSPQLTLTRESVLLLLVGVVVFGALRIERIDPLSLGFRRSRLSAVGWGLAGAAALIAAGVVFSALLSVLHLHQDIQTLTRLARRPWPMLLLVALTAAISEEIIFRSILIDHLGRLAGNKLVGAIGSVLLFAAAHLSTWSATQIFFVLPSGIILTLLFLWKRDIVACMIAHFLVDAIGLVAASASSPH